MDSCAVYFLHFFSLIFSFFPCVKRCDVNASHQSLRIKGVIRDNTIRGSGNGSLGPEHRIKIK